MGEFGEVFHHRLRYFLTPQFDMYRNIRADMERHPIENGSGLVLDYGCGNGVGSVLLCDPPRWKIYGIDSDEEAVAFAKDSWGHLVTFKRADWARKNGPLPATFDTVVCLEVIEHVEHPHELLDNLRMSLRSEGQLYISTLNHNSQYRKNRGHVGRYCVEDFRRLLQHHFPGVKLYEYTLTRELQDDDTMTPMVGVWRP